MIHLNILKIVYLYKVYMICIYNFFINKHNLQVFKFNNQKIMYRILITINYRCQTGQKEVEKLVQKLNLMEFQSVK